MLSEDEGLNAYYFLFVEGLSYMYSEISPYGLSESPPPDEVWNGIIGLVMFLIGTGTIELFVMLIVIFLEPLS